MPRRINKITHSENPATWIEVESACYPSGAQLRRCAVLFPDGKIRRAWCGIPDTFFSIPAHARIKGRYVAGYITSNDTGFKFVIYARYAV